MAMRNRSTPSTIDRAGRAFDEAAHGIEQRRFAGAVRSDQAGDLGADVGGQIVEAAHAAECDRQVADLDHSFRSIARGMSGRELGAEQSAQPDHLAGDALRRRDQRMEQAGAEHHDRQVAVDVPIGEQAGHRAQQQPGEDRSRPVERAADHREREQHDRFARRKRAAVELSDAARHQRARYAGKEARDARTQSTL